MKQVYINITELIPTNIYYLQKEENAPKMSGGKMDEASKKRETGNNIGTWQSEKRIVF